MALAHCMHYESYVLWANSIDDIALHHGCSKPRLYHFLEHGEHKHGVSWRGEQVCHSLERGAEAWCSQERGVDVGVK